MSIKQFCATERHYVYYDVRTRKMEVSECPCVTYHDSIIKVMVYLSTL